LKAISKVISIFLFFSVLITSCVPVTAVPTATLPPTKTLLPTNMSLPEPSATATQSQVGQTFTIPTMSSGFVNTPTPIAAPELSKSSLKLRTLSEENALNLIYEMNDYSYKNSPPFSDWGPEVDFVSSQEPIALAIQEYLYHYPESPNADWMHWQLAFINSIAYSSLAGNEYGNHWMLNEFQKRLNNGEGGPDQLETILDHYWLNVAYFQAVKNLFGDGKISWFYVVTPQVQKEEENNPKSADYLPHGGLFFVVREIQPHKFQVFFLNSSWNFAFGESSLYQISDHNQNGRPEIGLYIGYHSGTTCSGNLLIYEWKDDHFVELTKNQISIRDCGENFEYSTVAGSPSITYSGFFPGRTEIYSWNGAFYQFSEYRGATPLDIWSLSLMNSRLSYSQKEGLLENILNSGDAPRIGSAYPDYLRYELGTIYALDSKYGDAVRELQGLIDSPFDKTREIFPKMAKKFLSLYKDNLSVYAACHESNSIYDEAQKLYKNSGFDEKVYENVFGFPFDPYSIGISRCDEKTAFALLINSIPVMIKNLSAELKNNKADIDYSLQIDANLDGKADEWFFAFDTYDFFLVYPDGSHFSAKELDGYVEYKNISSLKVNIETWNGLKNPVMTIQSDEELAVLEIDKNYESKNLLQEFGVTDFRILSMDPVVQFQIKYRKPNNAYFPDHPWDGYHWDDDRHIFKNDLLEYQLFVLRDPKRAVQIAQQIYPILKDWKNSEGAWHLPYMYYLCGLSYELSSDEEKAAQIYWQLWHDFPDSHYALLARYKLELVNP